MHKFRTTTLFALLLASGAVFATAPTPKADAPKAPAAEKESPEDAAYSAKWSEAMKTIGTAEGAAYDEKVGAYLSTLPDYKPSVRACMERNPGKQNISGYLEYDAKGYRVKFNVETGFANCLKKFLEGREIPKPPRVPYLIPMSFTNDT